MGVYTVHICIHKANYSSCSSLLPPLWPLGTRPKLENWSLLPANLPPDQEYLPIFTPEGLQEVAGEENKRSCRHETFEHLSLGTRRLKDRNEGV
jgi:hypothetical protein